MDKKKEEKQRIKEESSIKSTGPKIPGLYFVKWFSELDKNSGNIAGGKGANLAEMANLKLPVPPGFVVTAQAYDYFIKISGIREKIKQILGKIDYENTKQLDENTKQIRQLITDSKIPKEIEEQILESYEDLGADEFDLNKKSGALDILSSSSEPIFVAVRSSATTEDLKTASFAGQQDTFLNVKGNNSLLENIKKCFASLFTSRATYYRRKQGFKHEQAKLAVIVQKMIDSDKSGVIFSKDPSYKNDNVIIEAVWGLGTGIVSGQINPDRYIISSIEKPEGLKILDKRIPNKKIAITRDASGQEKTVTLREDKSKAQVLNNYEIKKLTEYALRLEEHYKQPQDIEFAIENEGIYIVQTRPITTMEKRAEVEQAKQIKGEVILDGIAASPGIASGKIKIIHGLEDLSKIKQGDILVTEMTNPDMVVTMQKSAAIVTNKGGMTAHAAIVSREMGIPCVVGTEIATTKLKEGEIITVDGFAGKIYKGKVSETVKKEILPVTEKTKTKIKIMVDLPSFAGRAAKTNIKEVGLTRIEGIISESGKHPNYFLEKSRIRDYEDIIFKGIRGIMEHFNELWVRTSDIRTDEFQNLEGAPQEKEANPMLGMHGIKYGLKNLEILKAELNAMKRVVENSKDKKIGILIPQLISVDELKKVKEIIKQIDFLDVKVGVMIETPAAVQIIKELCEQGIDFISFGTNDLTQYTLAIDRGNEDVQYIYDEMNPAILHQLKYVIKMCKEYGVETSICGQAGSKKEMVKFLVENQIDSLSVNADAAHDITKYVAQLEAERSEGGSKEFEEIETKYQEELQEQPQSQEEQQKHYEEVEQETKEEQEAEQVEEEPSEKETVSSQEYNNIEFDIKLTDDKEAASNESDDKVVEDVKNNNEMIDEQEPSEEEREYNKQEKKQSKEQVLDIF